MNIGKAVKKLRNERGWAQEDLARNAKVRVMTVCNFEKNGSTSEIDTLQKIASGFSMKASELMRYAEGSKPTSIADHSYREEHRILHQYLEEILNGPDSWPTSIAGTVEGMHRRMSEKKSSAG